MSPPLLDDLRQLEREARLLEQSSAATLSTEERDVLSQIERRISELREELGLPDA